MTRYFNSLKGLLLILVIVCVAGFALLFAQGQFALRGLERAAVQMGDGKDIVADILPPPLYIIETHLVAYQLLDVPLAERPALVDQLKQLRSDYATRNTYWQGKSNEIDASASQSLLGLQKAKGEAYWSLLDKDFLPAALAGKDDEARKVFSDLKSLYLAHRGGVDTTVKTAGGWADARLADVSMTAERTRWVLTAVAALCVGLAVLIYFVVARRVDRLLGGEPELLRAEMVRLAEGNLHPSAFSCVEGSVLYAMRDAQQRIRALVEQTGRASETVDLQVGHLRMTLGTLNDNADRLADTAMSTSAAMEQITASIAMIEEQTKSAEREVSDTDTEAAHGTLARDQNQASVERIAKASQEAQQTVSELGQHSKEVTGIVQTIRDIAEQTNLLALNAAIEAARAGEQGRGFAVVADEVRKLAERTTDATAEIAQLIGTIQAGIEQAVCSIDTSVQEIHAGRASAEASAQVLSNIHMRVNVTKAAVADIVNATREVASATRQINENMSTVSSLAEAGQAAVIETTSAGEALSEVSVRMNKSLKVFSY
jgi:methyl-accepting chemotaxis protein